jgi:hypothetical protein
VVKNLKKGTRVTGTARSKLAVSLSKDLTPVRTLDRWRSHPEGLTVLSLDLD